MPNYIAQLKKEISSNFYEIPQTKEKQKARFLEHNPELLELAQTIAFIVSKEKAEPEYEEEYARAVVYGGFVRDALLGISSKDVDIEVYGLSPERLERVLLDAFPGRVKKVGKAFGIFLLEPDKLPSIDIVIPRKNVGDFDNSLENADPSIGIKEAAELSDFSINSLKLNPLSAEVYDPLNALVDLRDATLRKSTTETKLHGTRPFRAAQQASRLKLSITEETLLDLKLAVEQAGANPIHPSRAAEELKKLVLKSEKPSIGFYLMREFGIFKVCYPELEPLFNEPGIFNSSLELVDKVKRRAVSKKLKPFDETVLCLAAFFYPLFVRIEEEGEFVEIVHQFILKFSFSPGFLASLLTTTLHLNFANELLEKSELEVKSLAKPSARSSKMRPVRNLALSVTEEELYAKKLLRYLAVTKKEVFLIFYSLIFSEDEARKLEAVLSKYSLDDSKNQTLLLPDDLYQELRLKRGVHIGLIIGEIEKRRHFLVTRGRALSYVKDNLANLMALSEERSSLG